MSNEHIDTIVEMARRSNLAVIYYRKGISRGVAKPRLVEPYAFVQGKQDLMIRCFQLQHGEDDEESGWRFFMSHKIEGADITSIPFKARRPIKLPSGEVDTKTSLDEHWTESRQLYRDIVADALADGWIDPSEAVALKEFKTKHGLTDDDTRFVHASVYHRCLGAVLDDGFVTVREQEEIRFLHTAMRSLGWAVGE